MSPSNDSDDSTDDKQTDGQTDKTTCTFRATVTTEDGEVSVTTNPPDGATTSGDTEQGDVTGFSPEEPED